MKWNFVHNSHKRINKHPKEPSPYGRMYAIKYKTRIIGSSLLKSLDDLLDNPECIHHQTKLRIGKIVLNLEPIW